MAFGYFTMNDNSLNNTVRSFAQRHGLDYSLVCALIEQESSWNTWAYRFEPDFKKRYVDGLNLQPTETIGRSISWGLMQVLGQLAREEGFTGELPSLCEPMNGLEYGCKKLTRCLGQSAGDWTGALLRYNGGADPDYAEKVLARIGHYKENVTT